MLIVLLIVLKQRQRQRDYIWEKKTSNGWDVTAVNENA